MLERLSEIVVEAVDLMGRHATQLRHLAHKLHLERAAVLHWARTADPTPASRYLPWILTQLQSGKLTISDHERLKNTLRQFEHFKKSNGVYVRRGIDNYSTIDDLEALVSQFNGYDRSSSRLISGGTGATWARESPNFKIMEITTPEALRRHLGGTQASLPVSVLYGKDMSLEPIALFSKDFSSFRWLKGAVPADRELVDLLLPRHAKPMAATNLAKHFGLKGDKFIENKILRDPIASYNYAVVVRRARWAKAEPIISTDARAASRYAAYVLRGRWKDAEDIIALDPTSATFYAAKALGDRFPQGEPTVLRHPMAAVKYARSVLRARWPEAEATILTSPLAAANYAGGVLKARWPQAEAAIATDGEAALYYAMHVIGHRWGPGEAAITSKPNLAQIYNLEVPA